MKLYIKNMVCDRCIMVVRFEFQRLGFHPTNVALGFVELDESLNENDILSISEALHSLGFELIEDKKSIIIEKIKNAIVDLVHYKEEGLRLNLSDYLSKELQHDYTYLSNLFSKHEGNTIEKYFIAQKVEKVKELLEYGEPLAEIAFRLNYSSVAYLSNQFKKVTGYSPTEFKNSQGTKRKPLDEV